ncbi:hypothetical protein DXG01_004380, partial [Tephrocybe rancida]
KHNTRTATAKNILALKSNQEAPDTETWDYFVKLLNRLDVAGMSSEEEGSVNERGYVRSLFLVHICPWRATEITGYMDIIDKAANTPGIRSVRGSKPLQRVTSEVVSTSKAPSGLPRAMYDPRWLENMQNSCTSDYEELEVSEEAFDLLVLAAERLSSGQSG